MEHRIDPRKLDFICPPELKVKSSWVEFSREKIEQLTRRYILANMKWPKESVRIEGFNTKPVILPAGNVTYSLSHPQGDDFLGKFYGEISFRVDGELKRKTRVSGSVREADGRPNTLTRYRDRT